MANTLWIHVGLPKTSTTSYQSWMRSNTALLEKSGLHYPDQFGAGNDKHNFLVGNLRHNANLPILEGILSKANSTQLLLSDEGLTNHLDDFRPEALERFRDLTQNWAVKVILVTRESGNWTRSYHKQCVLNPNNGASPLWGTSLTCDEISAHPRIKRLVSHASLAKDLKTAFGAESVNQFNYENPKWFLSSLNLMGVKLNETVTLPRSNQSLPDWSIELLRKINGHTNQTDIRNQWKMALQNFLGSDHTILTNLGNSKQRVDEDIFDYLTSIQDEFLSEHIDNIKKFLTSLT